MPLTAQQRRFCDEYLIDYCPMKAMLRAGYPKSTASKNSARFMRSVHVAAYLKEKVRKQSEKSDLTAERVLEELRRLAFANAADYFKLSKDGKNYVPKELSELTREQTAAIAEIAPGKSMKLYSKDAALDKLSKHFKLYSDIDATVHNLVVMPTMRISGKEVVFEVGKPAPAIVVPKKKN